MLQRLHASAAKDHRLGFLSLGSCFVAAMGNSTGTTLTAMFLHFNAIIVEHCEMSEFVYSQIFESLIVYKSYG